MRVREGEFFVLRTPLLPYDEWTTWSRGLAATESSDDGEALEAALAEDRNTLRSRLREILARSEVREALFLASPSLSERLDAWEADSQSESGRKAESAIVDYFSRMAGRATPFGLFAGCSVGSVGAETQMALAGRSSYARRTHLRIEYVAELVRALVRERSTKARLPHRPNSSLSALGGRLWFARWRPKTGDEEGRYITVSIPTTDNLLRLLTEASGGATPQVLAASLLSWSPALTAKQAWDQVDELIASEVLVADVALGATGAESIDRLIDNLETWRLVPHVTNCLREVRERLKAIDVAGLGVSPKAYIAIADTLEALPAPVPRASLFQVDMRKPLEHGSLGASVIQEVKRGVSVLSGIMPRRKADAMSRFRSDFLARYGAREVPLVEALHEEYGVGFGGHDADAYWHPDGVKVGTGAPHEAPFRERDKILMRRVAEVVRAGGSELVLSDDDIRSIEEPETRMALPDSFAVVASLIAESERALARGEFRVRIASTYGPSAAMLLGRFCLSDNVLNSRVERVLRLEEAMRPEAVFAEVVHIPNGSMGNILRRPELRAHEIPLACGSSVPPARQILVSDLLVSLVGTRILLRSSRMGCEVVPRLTSAHNFNQSTGLPVYRFLGALQSDGLAGRLAWRWGPLLASPFLPRVSVGRVVLSPARWTVTGPRAKELGGMNEVKFCLAMRRMRANEGLPRRVRLVESDNMLPIDLDNALSLDALRRFAARGNEVILEEDGGETESCVSGPEGRFVHEIVIPFTHASSPGALEAQKTFSTLEGVATEVKRPTNYCTPVGDHGREVRQFPPGSEWLLVGVHCGPGIAEDVLLSAVEPVVRVATTSGAVERWFFRRDDSVSGNINVAMHGSSSARLLAEVIPGMKAALSIPVSDKRVWRWQVGTYERAVEAYGGWAGIDIAERLFASDSSAVLEMLTLAPDKRDGDCRWRLATYATDAFLSDAGLSIQEKYDVATHLYENQASVCGAGAPMRRKLGDKFRRERVALESLLAGNEREISDGARLFEVIRRRTDNVVANCRALKSMSSDGALGISQISFVAAVVRENNGRLLRAPEAGPRLSVYYFLSRLYEAEMERARR